MMAMTGEHGCIPVITLTTSEAGNQVYTQSLLNTAPVPSVTVVHDDLTLCCDVTQLPTHHSASQTFDDGIYNLGGEQVQYLVLGKDGQFTQVPVLSVDGNQPEEHAGDHTMEITGNQAVEMMGNQQLAGENDGKRRDGLQCGLCGEMYEDVLKFLQHKSGHVGRGAGVGCEFCHLSFSRQVALTEHYRRKHKVVFERPMPETKPIKVAKTHYHHKAKGRRAAANQAQTDAGVTYCRDSCARVNPGRDVKLQSQLKMVKMDGIINNTENIVMDISEGRDSSRTINADMEIPDVHDETLEVVRDTMTADVRDMMTTDVRDTMTTDVRDMMTGDVKHEFKYEGLKNNANAVSDPAFITVYGIDTAGQLATAGQLGTAGQLSDNLKQVQQVSLLTGNVSNSTVFVMDEERKPTIFSTDNIAAKPFNEQTVDMPSNEEGNNHDEHLNGDEGNISEILQTNECDDENKAIKHTKSSRYQVKAGPNPRIVMKTESTKEVCISLDGVTDDLLQDKPELSHDGSVATLDHTINKSSELPAQVLCTDHETVSIAVEDHLNSEKENTELSEKVTPAFENISKIVNTRKDKDSVKDLDMPDFHFILAMDHAPKRSKVRGGKCNFKCLYCDNKCSWRSTICRHMTEKHSDILKVGGLLMISPEDIELKPGQSVTKMSEYVKQERSCKRIRGIEKQDLPGDFPCDKCGKMFHRLRYLRKHLLLHKSEKNFLCTECVKSFKTIANLKQHMKTHRDREMFKCSQCNFESNINKAIHLHRQIHSGGCVLCDICGRAYNDRSTLAKHMHVHDIARPYPCNYPGCTWRFRTMMMCHAHYRTHTTKGKFECGECGYLFRKKHHLYRHERKAHNIFSERRAYYRYTEPVAIEYNYVEDHTTVEKLTTVPQSGDSAENVVDMVTDGVSETPCVGDSVTVEEQFDLECALQNRQLVIATDTGAAINYEMSDIGMAGGYQTLLHDGEGNQLDSATILIPQSDGSHILYQHEETIDTEDPA